MIDVGCASTLAETAPRIAAADAILIDTSDLSPEAVVDKRAAIARQSLAL